MSVWAGHAVVAVVVAGLAPTLHAGHAHRRHAPRRAPLVFSDPLAAAELRAARYWGGTPCGGAIAVVIEPASNAPPAGQNAPGAGRFAAMWATWTTPAGANLIAQSPATFTACTIHVNVSIWPSTRAEDANFPAYCKEIVHEYGHFEGHADAGALPGTVEYERPDLARLPLCERYRLQYGRRVYSGAPSGHRRPRRHRRSGR